MTSELRLASNEMRRRVSVGKRRRGPRTMVDKGQWWRVFGGSGGDINLTTRSININSVAILLKLLF